MGRQAKLYIQVPVEDCCTELFFNRNIILLLKNRIKLFCWLSYLSGILLLSAGFFFYTRNVNYAYYWILLKGLEGFFWYSLSKFLLLQGISGASFGYLASQIYGQESLLII